MKADMGEEKRAQGGGNDGLWTRRKTKGRFPSASTALGNRKRRDSHIPTAPTTKPVEKWKSKSRISTFPPARFPLSQTNDKTKERRPGGGSLRSRLQAHSSMRKCSDKNKREGFLSAPIGVH